MMPTALFVTHMDDLLKFDAGQHEGIIFDDMSFLHLHREGQIHLVDVEQPRSIHCRYSAANIPANTPKIVTTNNEGGKVVDLFDAAIKRRCLVLEWAEKEHEPEHEPSWGDAIWNGIDADEYALPFTL